MKTLVLAFTILLLVTSCDVYYYEPVVPDPVYVQDLFSGSYDVDEFNGSDGRYFYSISVNMNDTYSLTINNLYDARISVDATIRDNHFYIGTQTIDGYTISGDGSTDGSTMLINYYVTDTYQPNPVPIYCQAVAKFY